jgi:hypothetical protein
MSNELSMPPLAQRLLSTYSKNRKSKARTTTKEHGRSGRENRVIFTPVHDFSSTLALIQIGGELWSSSRDYMNCSLDNISKSHGLLCLLIFPLGTDIKIHPIRTMLGTPFNPHQRPRLRTSKPSTPSKWPPHSSHRFQAGETH